MAELLEVEGLLVGAVEGALLSEVVEVAAVAEANSTMDLLLKLQVIIPLLDGLTAEVNMLF